MNRQYNTSNSKKYQEIRKKIKEFRRVLSEKLKENGVIKRRRKVKSTEILAIAICKLLAENLSFKALSSYMAVRYNITMSDTAWEKQLSKCAEALREASKEITSAYAKAKEIYLIDATNVSSEGVNCDTMRLHCSYNLSRQDIDETLVSDFHTEKACAISAFTPARCI